jgi:peptide methionine sulfoxide reductase MsrA
MDAMEANRAWGFEMINPNSGERKMTDKGESKEQIYSSAKEQHAALDSRLLMLQKKPYLTADEEMEIKVLKKKKLYFKDLMEKMGEEMKRGAGK